MADRLNEIDHIVVLMLENRSFDHMLGYLSLPPAVGGKGRTDVDGLTGSETNNDENGDPVPVQRMGSPKMNGDPCHEWDCVEEQLNNDNGGFFINYDKTVASNPEYIMHYFTGADVPVFDHLARDFTICDRWFCSLPGPTQPNRAYALAGTSDGHKHNFSKNELLTGVGFVAPTIFELLPNHVTWQCYSHDISALRFFENFRTKRTPRIAKIDKFREDAANGNLANVSWIDPDFGLAIYVGPPNDDHPPHDMRHCQNLVSDVYNALLSSPQWSKTLLIVTYDEHGGFYDHVSPRQFTPEDNHAPEFAKYGVRVPTFLISPWVGKQAAFGSQDHGLGQDKVIFDHTSILKTILRRFASDATGNIPNMTKRVDAANDLGALLTENQPRTDCTATPIIPNVPIRLQDNFRMAAGRTELQDSLNAVADHARVKGLVPSEEL